MQTMLKIFDIGSMENMAEVTPPKIAIRVNSNDSSISDRDEADFVECFRKFLSSSDDKDVKSSLGALEWVSLDGEEGGLTPVIDFTDGLENTSSLEELIKSFYTIGSDQTLSASGWQAIETENKVLADIDTTIEKLFSMEARNTADDVVQARTQITLEGDEKTLSPSFNKVINSQINPKENVDSAIADEKSASVMMNEKIELIQTNTTSSKHDLNTRFPDVQQPIEESPEHDPVLKAGESSTLYKSVKNLQTGQSTQQFQMMDKEKEAASQPQHNDKDNTTAFQRIFADNASNSENTSASLQNDASNGGGVDLKSHASPPGTETQMHSTGFKSADFVPSTESGNTQPVSNTLENDVIRQIVQRMTLRSSGDQSRMTIQLKPEFLGNLKLEITTENQHVAIKMTAESSTVKEMIEHNIGILKTELHQHKLNIDKIDVYVGQDSQSWEHQQHEAASWQESQGKMRRIRNIGTQEDQNDPLQEITDDTADTLRTNRSSEIDFFA